MSRLNLQRNRARLSGQEFTDETFEGLDLRNSVAQQSRWKGCTFRSVRFDGSALGDATFDGCRFERCSFQGATLVSRIYRSTFERCNLDRALLVGADLKDTTLRGCRAQFSDWTRASLADCKLDVDFRGACLNFALTTNVDFSGSNLWSALVPFNCAMVYGNRFDTRTIGALVALLSYAEGPRDLLDELASNVSEKTRKLVEKFVKYETGEEAG